MSPWHQNLSTFFGKLLHSAPDVTEGLYWLSMWSVDGSLATETFDSVLQQLVIPHILKDAGVALSWRLRNTSPQAHGGNTQNGQRPKDGGPCALLVRMKDIKMLWTSPALQQLAIGRRDMAEACIFGTEARTYELVQRFQGRRGARVKGSCVVAVFIDPADGTEDDVDQWYRQEHLALIAASPVHIRTTRYRARSGLVHGAYDDGPTLLALHECTSAEALLDYAIKHGAIVPETPWGKRVFGGAKSVQRSVWDITGGYLHPDIKLDKL